jgi:hypothetical protein
MVVTAVERWRRRQATGDMIIVMRTMSWSVLPKVRWSYMASVVCA